jgi:hypothetical protein
MLNKRFAIYNKLGRTSVILHMHPYSFNVSLRVNHPTRDLSFLSDLLSLERRYGWISGEERRTPKGTRPWRHAKRKL